MPIHAFTDQVVCVSSPPLSVHASWSPPITQSHLLLPALEAQGLAASHSSLLLGTAEMCHPRGACSPTHRFPSPNDDTVGQRW